MYVSRLQIDGFRGVRRGEVILGPHSVLVGANNAGKTTIVDALNLVLGRGGMRRRLTEYDFYGGSPQPSDRVRIRAVITGFPSDDPARNPETFQMEKGGIPMWWDSANGELCPTTGPGRTLAVEVGFCARFDDELLEEEYVLYFVDDEGDPFIDEHVRKVGDSFRRMLGLYLVPARRTWEAMWSFRSPLFRQVIGAQAAMPGASLRAMRDSLRDSKSRIEDQAPFADIVARLNQELGAFLRPEKAEIRFRATEGDTPAVLEAITPHVRARSGVHLPLAHHGLGLISLQTLLLLLEFGRRRRAAGENFILVAEEPELHLHPGHHRRLVARMRGVADQTIVTTHSPEVASFFRPQEIVAVHCSQDGRLWARPLIALEDEMETNALIRLFTLHRADVCEGVMGEVVVVPEGKTDFQWLRGLAMESVTAEGFDGASTDEAPLPLGIVPTQDAHVVTTFSALSRAVPQMIALVDGDAAGDEYRKALQRLDRPPARIVMLSPGWSMEHLVAWVIRADLDRFDEVERALAPGEVNPDTLASVLQGPELKTRWDRHELLAGLVGQSAPRATAARAFLRGLGELGMGQTPTCDWFRADTELSSERTEVWVFHPVE
jgi:putative ATP-dependent endonuclease of the OLD family